MNICGWFDDGGYEEDSPPPGPKCGAPAMWVSCVPFINTPTCQQHKCRCASRIAPCANCGEPTVLERYKGVDDVKACKACGAHWVHGGQVRLMDDPRKGEPLSEYVQKHGIDK